MEKLERQINNYIENCDEELEITAISIIPFVSEYYSQYRSEVAFRRVSNEKNT